MMARETEIKEKRTRIFLVSIIQVGAVRPGEESGA